MPHGDWVPDKNLDRIVTLKKFRAGLANVNYRNDFRWDAAGCDALIAHIDTTIAKNEAYEAAKTPENRIAKDNEMERTIKLLRKWTDHNIRSNDLVPDEVRVHFGVGTEDGEPSPVHPPENGPDSKAHTDPAAPGVVAVRYAGAKPYGVYRVEIAWALSDTPLDSPLQLANHETFSHNPWEHTFGPEDRGKKMYYSLRYLTSTGESHWSDVKEVVVP